ncbi:MAG TPA: hypothetical protein VMG30_13075 [Acidobacteriota bacterium]|nr:hypothetical protein [Acidobacteriota bacterium]
MTTGKHEHLIKPLSIGAVNWEEKKGQPGASVIGPGNAKKEIWLNGRDHLEGMNFNFSWGVHNTVGEWHASSKSHIHPTPECLFFVGLDTANVNYLGAEVECCLGDEGETYTFNDPTVIVIPAGLPHGPITTRRLFSPRGFGFFAASLGAASGITWSDGKNQGAKQASAAGKHAHLVKPLKSGLITERGTFNASRLTPEQRAKREELQKKTGFKQGPGNTDHMAWMYGQDLEGLNVNIAWGFASQPGIWQRGVGAHTHPADEILMFLGTDPDNTESLGAEIEIDLGQEHERYFFDKSSAILCPAGFPHGPIVTRWVDKPFAFLLVNLAGDVTTSFEAIPE